ncbi:MAG: hypothetical protein JWQ61_882 [Collimonas fungivorans]|nr:hypothetical protein [Collimonas fungivorans]
MQTGIVLLCSGIADRRSLQETVFFANEEYRQFSPKTIPCCASAFESQ